MDQQANLYSRETLNNQNRITAYDGVAKTIGLTLEKNNKVYERTVDHITQELLIMKRNQRTADVALETANNNAVQHIATADTALKSIPQVASAIQSHKKRYKEAAFFQSKSSAMIANDKKGVQLSALMHDIDFDIPNPFALDEIKEENWGEYQRQLTLLFNTHNLSNSGLSDKQSWLKRQLALYVITKTLSESVKIPDTASNNLTALTGEPTVSIKSALFERYKQVMTDINTQTNTKAAPLNSLLVIHNIQLSQKNLLLSEIKQTKQLKNALLSLPKI